MKSVDSKKFSISFKDFDRGANSFSNIPDGCFQSGSFGYNVFSKPGLLGNAPDIGSTVTNSLPIGIGFSWAYGKGSLGQEVMVVGNNSSQDGSFWTVSGSGAFTQVGADDSAHDYQPGFSWTQFYHGNYYTTSKTDMTKNSVDLVTRDTSWWVTTKAQSALNSLAPHPQCVFGDIRYIADGRYIHQDDDGSVQSAVFDLGVDWVITELCVYNNLIYIAAEPYYNYLGGSSGLSKIFTWNGYSDSWIDEYEIGPRVNAMKVFKGIMFIWTSKFFGYFNGSIMKNLRPMSSASVPCYSSGIAVTEDSMYYPDNTILVRYGQPHPTSGFKAHMFQSADLRINGVGSYAAEKIEMCTTGSSAGSNFIFDSNGTPGGNRTFRLNTRYFERPIKVTGYIIETNGMSSGQYVEVSYIDGTGSVRDTKRFGYSTSTSMQGKESWYFDCATFVPTAHLDPYITIAGDVYVRRITYLYDECELRGNA